MICADCERDFELSTDLQRKNGERPRGWLCPTCRFNDKYAAFMGFVRRVINV